jgi:hypothetical protein
MEMAANQLPSSARTVGGDKAKHGRSAATNHRDLLPHIADGRQAQARRFRDLVRSMITDAGGISNCTEIRLGLIRRLAAATVLSEELEGKAVNGEAVDITTPRDVSPSLADILREGESDA